MKMSLSSGTTLRATISALLLQSTHQEPILHVQFSQHQVGRRSHHTSSNMISPSANNTIFKGFLVTGGFRCRSCTESEHLTELYLPSNNRWTSGKSLPRWSVSGTAAHLQGVPTNVPDKDCWVWAPLGNFVLFGYTKRAENLRKCLKVPKSAQTS